MRRQGADFPDEAALLDEARRGNGQAFAALVEPHLALMYRVAARVAGNAALAEDAVQETLEILHKRLGRYEAGTSFRAFVAAAAVGRARTLLRAERRRKRREEGAPTPHPPETPAEVAIARDTARRITDALARLPEKRQRVVLLRLDAGLGYAEIANLVGTTEGSARVLVHHALRDLSEKLGQPFDSALPRRRDIPEGAT
jgi:RNA polymerase sigma-70 factor (ECF subfamily)